MDFYIAQERGLAPGIVKEWPDVIPHPTDKNGRLKKISEEELTILLTSTKCSNNLKRKKK